MASVSGLQGVVVAETDLSLVDGENGRLVYRGHWAKDLALSCDFEEAAYLLWYGELPTSDQLLAFKEAMAAGRKLPDTVQTVIDALPDNMPMMAVLRTALSALGTDEWDWPPTVEQAVALTALTPTIIAYRHRRLQRKAFCPPNPELGHVTNYLYMLNSDDGKGVTPQSAHVRALNAYLVLTMEHGMNASTFAARVVASTQSDMASAVAGALGAMKGPLHGGAPSEVIHMLDDIGTKPHAEPWMRAALERGERLMGFGHRVYKTRDPRAEALSEITAQLAGQDEWLDLAKHVEATAIRLLEEYKPGRRLYTNVEFYAAAVLRAVGMPQQLYTPTFTASRMVGWTAHILEQASINRLFRPQSIYTGPMPQ